MSYGIHWFRRDLRVAGNPALQWNYRQHEGRVVGLFCFDKKFLARPDFSAGRFAYYLKTLRALREELRERGSDLLVLDIGPEQAFSDLKSELEAKGQSLGTVSWNRDYEPFAVERDQRMSERFRAWNVPTHTERDHLLLEPAEIFKPSAPSESYQVYTPFSKRWLESFRTPAVRERLTVQAQALSNLKKKSPAKSFSLTWDELPNRKPSEDLIARYEGENRAAVSIALPPVGTREAQRSAEHFRDAIAEYGEARDFPAVRGTSRFSIYFKNGSFTVPQAIVALDLHRLGKLKVGEEKFLKELIWREFYYHILARHPGVEHDAFLEKFKNLAWENREDYWEAWKQGQTGFPIVDAGMRELNQTGWMHNRVRMIVASFLTKDLLIDWRWGERYFMEKLLDGDLAPNNGGWQWAASTGCDPQPYFRIFNPVLQSRKFDPEGTYLRRFLPELAHLNAKDIHEPPPLLRGEYPLPIVVHAEQRAKALQLYQV